MEPDFMNNITNMLKNGNIPEDVKKMMNQFSSSSTQKETSEFNNSSTENNSQEGNSSSNSINPEMIQNLMKFFQNSNSSNNTNQTNTDSNSNSNSSAPNIDMEFIFKMKNIMDKMNESKNDPRSNLLLSLKPYLKESRKSKIEQYIQLFSMTNIMDALNQNGGEKIK